MSGLFVCSVLVHFLEYFYEFACLFFAGRDFGDIIIIIIVRVYQTICNFSAKIFFNTLKQRLQGVQLIIV